MLWCPSATEEDVVLAVVAPAAAAAVVVVVVGWCGEHCSGDDDSAVAKGVTVRSPLVKPIKGFGSGMLEDVAAASTSLSSPSLWLLRRLSLLRVLLWGACSLSSIGLVSGEYQPSPAPRSPLPVSASAVFRR